MWRRLGPIVAILGCGSPPAPLPRELAEPRSEPPDPEVDVQRAAGRVFGAEDWTLEVDRILGTPRAMYGRGIAFGGGALRHHEDLAAGWLGPDGRPREAALAHWSIAFVHEHAELFRAEVAPAGVSIDRDVWAVALAQQHRGLPVIGGHVGLTFSHGRLTLVQGATYPIAAELDVAPRIDRHRAIAVAGQALARPRPGDRDEARLVIVPERAPGTVAYRLAWEIDAWRGPDHAIAYVDARDGRLAALHDGNRYDYPGVATNRVDDRTVGDEVVRLPAAYLRLASPRGVVVTDGAGAFAFRGEAMPLMVRAELRGAYVDVRNVNGPSARFVGMMLPDRANALAWDEARSRPDERDVFRAVTTTNRFVATVFPDLEWISRPLRANVNLPRSCNAFWNGASINFFTAGGGCNNSGRIFDVVAHEWGHGLDQHAPGGALDGALGEFIGDLLAFVQTASPLIGPGFFTSGKAARDLEDPEYECYDPKQREVHAAGHLLGAVVWDIHQDLVAAGVTGERLKRLLLLPIASAQTRSQWYRAMLAVDDDDGDLANGTPHECLIYRQFKAHSCKGVRWPGIPAEDPPHCK